MIQIRVTTSWSVIEKLVSLGSCGKVSLSLFTHFAEFRVTKQV